MAPQIIVIPQTLLQQNQNPSQSLLRISPQPKFRVIASSPSPNQTASRAIMSSPVSRPVATVVGCKRPAPPLSPEFDIKDIKEEEDEEDELAPVRKRANLDHLSPEERLMRRKLKNRVAAQNARDKKKAQCEEMEKLINQMKEDRKKLLEENSRLQEFNTKLQLDNASLQEENTELKQRLGINPINPHLTISPPSPPSTPTSSQPAMSPSAMSPSTDITSSILQPRESSEFANDLQNQGCKNVWRKPFPSPGLSSKLDLTRWKLECLMTMWCVAVLVVIAASPSSHPPLQPTCSAPPPNLPLKKRSRALAVLNCMTAPPPE